MPAISVLYAEYPCTLLRLVDGEPFCEAVAQCKMAAAGRKVLSVKFEVFGRVQGMPVLF